MLQRTATIVVIGHGLAGKEVVTALSKHKNVRVVVVEGRDFYEADVMAPVFLDKVDLYSKFSWSQSLSQVPEVTYVRGLCVRIDPADKGYDIVLKTGQTLHADSIVLCVGSKIPLLKPETDMTLDARASQLAGARKAIANAQSILIAGGGTVGVEIAGTANNLKKADAKVTLAVSGDTVLNDAFPAGVRARLEAQLERRGVQILKNARVTGPLPITYSATPASYELANGSSVQADVFIPSFSTWSLPFLSHIDGATDASGRLAVDGSLQGVKLPGVFAVACASTDNMLNAPIIAHAAKIAAANARASAHNAPLTPYSRALPGMTAESWVHIELGEYSAIVLPKAAGVMSFCCGWPLPCICCLPGCCTPCGYSCSPAEGKGVSQFFYNMQVHLGRLPHCEKLKKPGNPLAAPTPAEMV